MYVNWSWEEQGIDCTVLKPIYDVLGCSLVSALIGFDSFTGCDTV